MLAGFCIDSSDSGLLAPIHPREVDEPVFKSGFYAIKPLQKLLSRNHQNQNHYPGYNKNGSGLAEYDATERMHNQALAYRLKDLVCCVSHYH